MSRTSDDFPEPEIPATVVIAPTGMRSVTSLRLCPEASTNSSQSAAFASNAGRGGRFATFPER